MVVTLLFSSINANRSRKGGTGRVTASGEQAPRTRTGGGIYQLPANDSSRGFVAVDEDDGAVAQGIPGRFIINEHEPQKLHDTQRYDLWDDGGT
jgi:hypothetical protein